VVVVVAQLIRQVVVQDGCLVIVLIGRHGMGGWEAVAY
jgi:hypothetical protein